MHKSQFHPCTVWLTNMRHIKCITLFKQCNLNCMQFKYTLIVLSSQHLKIHCKNKDRAIFGVMTQWLRSTALIDESSDSFEPFCTLSVPSNLTQRASGAEQESSALIGWSPASGSVQQGSQNSPVLSEVSFPCECLGKLVLTSLPETDGGTSAYRQITGFARDSTQDELDFKRFRTDVFSVML